MSQPLTMLNSNDLPVWYRRVCHNHNRRAFWHDYTSRSYYMFTVNIKADAPRLSQINGDTLKQFVNLSDAGRCVTEAISSIKQKYRQCTVTNRVIMPDHVHFIIFVKSTLPQGLGAVVSFFKLTAANACTGKGLIHTPSQLFEQGFNDRIVIRSGQLDTLKRYVKDNPRRLLIRRANPDYFFREQVIELGGHRWGAIGNTDLLHQAPFATVHFSSRLSEFEWSDRCDTYNSCLAKEGTLVSPFIHKNEAAFLHRAFTDGGNVIKLDFNQYSPRRKPGGDLFELCADGRALILFPPPEIENFNISRSHCRLYNEAAARIAAELNNKSGG